MYRPIQRQDLVVGKEVVYVRQDLIAQTILTTILDDKIMPGDTIRLRHKSAASIKRVFVSKGFGTKAAEDSPQVGAEAAVGAKAAFGALAAADKGAFNMDVDEDASRDNADQFLRTHVVPWLNQLEQNAVTNAYSMPEYLAAALSTSGKSPEFVDSECGEVHMDAVGSSSNNSMHEQWALLNVQTALANWNTFDEWSVVLVACGLWVTLKENLIPSLLMPESAVQGLDKVLRSEMSFRADLAAVSAKDPPANTSAVGDLAS